MRLGNRYATEEQIAVGGMGTVYRARDERLHRSVAIKVLKDHLTHDERFVERFRREARAVASLAHPNIASLYDYGEDEGSHFIVMELVEGSDLARILQNEGALEAQRAQGIAEQVCDGLAAAHSVGIVHRDVKPANILLTKEGTAKVTDFGIARATGDSRLTVTGSILGTAHYLAPEQAAGEPASAATDVYALGVVLFEMLTGTVPFTADSPVSVAARHMNDPVPAPSSLAASVPAHLDEVVRTATAKDPGRRYPDAAAMGRALRGAPGASTSAATAQMSPAAARTAPLPVLGSGFDMKRAALMILGGLALIALVLLGFRLLGGTDDPERRRGGRAAETAPAQDDTETQPEEQRVAVPEVRGLELTEAILTLEEEGLTADVTGPSPTGEVIGAEPVPGSEVPEGTTVTLHLADDVELPEPDDEPDDADEGDEGEGEGPPPHSNGKGKGKDKEKKDK